MGTETQYENSESFQLVGVPVRTEEIQIFKTGRLSIHRR